LLETHGARLARALHDVLLAVRELCSFALEQDGRWSSLNNQRKYRVSQLYSSLLDIVSADALRDVDHLTKVAAAATTDLSKTTCAALLRSFQSSNPGGQPRSEEAQRQLMFFCNSLRFTSLKTPSPLAQVRSWTALTPYYAEDVKYRQSELVTPLEDEKTLFSLIVATFAHDFDNFKERIGALGTDDDVVLHTHWKKAQTWASDRTQSLSRCVRGVTLYGDALRLLARLEGYDDATAELLVRSKFEFLVSAQIFGKQRLAPPGSLDKFKADAIEELIKDHRDLKVCFVHVPLDPLTEDFASCLIGRDATSGECRVDFKIKLPGNPIIGEGKPENQNQAVIFARGAYLQTLDMNQDNYLGESYKMRNLLDVFHGDVVLVGFPETIFSETHGAVAQFAAISEFIFQTFQRFMTWPLMVRFHYGHPDVWDKAFTMTNGGVSKASRAIHVAEDFFGGVNAIARGGKVIFEEFIECGKGRDMGFTSVNGFEQKISGSSGTISMSRDLFRLHRGMDAFRVFSLFFSGPGFFISMMQTAWCVYLYILAHATLAVADLEIYRVYRYFKMTETQTSLSLSKEEGGYYNSIYAIQLGLLTVLPLFLKMTVDRGLRDGFEYTISSLIQGSWAFNVFTMATKGYNYARALIFGQAQYIGTERGYVLQNASMVVLYGLYAKSHLYQGLELFIYLLLFHVYTSLPKSLLYTWSVWMFAGSVVIAPWWFSPQATNLFWMQSSWSDWRRWIDGNFPNKNVSHGSWQNWHAHMFSPWREILSPWYKILVVLTSGLGRIVLTLVCVASLHGNTQIDGVAQISQFGVNTARMAFASSFTMGVCVVYYVALRSKFLSRKPWLSFPEHLWKLSVYRGLVRISLVVAWFGFYGVFSYDKVDGVSSSRTLAMTVMGCVSITACVIEGWSMIGDRDIEHIFDFAMPSPDLPAGSDPKAPPPQRNWRHNYAAPVVLETRRCLKRARDFADFWFCELDKACGAVIFGILFVFSLLPIASVQTVLIWNETFSDVIKQRVRVNECIQEIID
jgi:1,3-beta-glucan synthase